MPFGFVLGLVRARMVRSTALGSLVAGLAAPGQIRDALAAALRDPSLELAFWVPARSRYVTAEGHDFALPEDDPLRAVIPVERGGERVAAIIHHPSLAEDPVLLRAAAAAAGLGLERERLEAELRARIVQLRGSRTALVDAGDRERRRLERNLHDGAQQRLVALSLTLRLARGASATNPESAAALLASAGQELHLALGELDELAKGINPAAVAENGLVEALDDLARRFPVPVELDIADRVPLGDGVRDAAYFVVSEALANVAKYAGASRVIVRVDSAGETLVVEVGDDGVGGADPAAGSGLRGLAGRVEALNGRLDVVSPPGRGYHQSGDAMRVVIADDSVLLREGIARVLTEAGIEVAAQAGDAVDLLLAVRTYTPDVAITDIRMPPTQTDEGMHAARQIRERYPRPACSCCRSTSSRSTRWSCSQTARRASAIC